MQIATLRPQTIDLNQSIEDAAALMAEHGFRHLPAVMRKRLCGMISERDVLKAIGTFRSANAARAMLRPQGKPVCEFMSSPAIALPKNAPLAAALRCLLDLHICAVPIVDKGGKPLAIVSEIDVLRAFDEIVGEPAGAFVTMHLNADVVCIQSTQTCGEAVALMEQSDCRELPVLDEDSIVGVMTDRDLLTLLGGTCSPAHALKRSVAEVMGRSPITGTGDFTLSDIAKMFVRLRITALPIVQGPELLGFITMSDLLRLCLEQMDDAAAECCYECGHENNKPFCKQTDRMAASM